MNNQLTNEDVLNMISTQRLTNENFQLRDTVVALQAAVAGKDKMIETLEREAEEALVTKADVTDQD